MANVFLNWKLHVSDRAHIADSSIALSATSAACASDVRIALSTLILVVSLALLSGVVWMHAT